MPIFGLVFGTIGLYHLMETRVSFYTELVNDYDKYMQVMTRLNFAYQHIKFWECIQPGMYLARALPYISTGRIVEGYTVSSNENNICVDINHLICFLLQRSCDERLWRWNSFKKSVS